MAIIDNPLVIVNTGGGGGGGGEELKSLIERSCTSFIIPDGVSEIGENAFYKCGNLTDVVIPNGVTVIKANAFNYCTSLSDIDIPEGVTTIETGAFSNTGITHVELPASIEIVAGIANASLEYIEVSENNPNFSSISGILYSKDKTSIIIVPSAIVGDIVLPDELTSLTTAFRGKNISSITLNNNINSIPASCFRECYELEHLYFDENLCFSSIDSNAFYSCNKLTGINLKFSGSGTIGMNAFYGCHSITSATLDFSNCTTASFGRMCFASCRAMEKFYFEGPTFALSDSMFSSCVNLKTVVLNTPSMVTGRASAFSSSLIATSETEGYIYVPDSLVDTYTANSVWSTYASKIKPLSELLA